MSLQRTLKREVILEGIGLHSGLPTEIRLKPGNPNQGIVFTRSDLESAPPIQAHYRNVVCTKLATTLGEGSVRISTVEHVLAALAGLGIDNATIEVSGPEVPIMDGSAAVFFDAIQKVGVQSQMVARSFARLKRRIELRVGDKWAIAEPAPQLEIKGSVHFDHPFIGPQKFTYIEGKTSFQELCRARTFGFLKDVEALKKMGLARGGSLDNAVVLDHALVLNPEGLRYTDEFVRHKVLDALGDFKLAGVHLQASIELHRAGHDLHAQLLTEIFRDPSHFEIHNGAKNENLEFSRVAAPLACRFATTY